MRAQGTRTNMPVSKLLVTGGSGFIGSNFLHHLFHRASDGAAPTCCPDHAGFRERPSLPKPDVLNVDKLTYAADPRNVMGLPTRGYAHQRADICDAEAVARAFRKFQPEAVVHFAAESHVDRSIESGRVFVESNALGTQVLLDEARRHDVGFFLHVSTDEVYGSIVKGSFREDDPLQPSSPYSASKAASDLLVQAHQRTYGIRSCIVRCTNNYGPRQNPEKLLPKIITLASRDERVPIYGDGGNVRDWLYVKDHCEALLTLLARRPDREIFNVAGGNEQRNLDVARQVLGALGKPESLIRLVSDRPGHDWRYSLDDSKLRSLGWKPRVSFAQGLGWTLDWLRVGGANARPPTRGRVTLGAGRPARPT